MRKTKNHELVFIVGGARSGKSAFAVSLAKSWNRKTAFVATCDFHDAHQRDSEMMERVKRHKKGRPRQWTTIEAGGTPFYLGEYKIPHDTQVLLVDCLSLWVSWLVMRGETLKQIQRKCGRFLKKEAPKFQKVILVSNEVGSGVVPETALGRNFRDALGKINQDAAGRADKVFFVVSGMPVELKQLQKQLLGEEGS